MRAGPMTSGPLAGWVPFPCAQPMISGPLAGDRAMLRGGAGPGILGAMRSTPSTPGPLDRVSARLPAGTLEALDGLGGADLTSLRLALARRRAARTAPAHVMRRAEQDRFVRPGASDPRHLWSVEARLWRLLPEQFEAVELSPLVPLGTCAATADVAQDRVVSTVRGSEVLADPTNALAVVAAGRRQFAASDPTRPVHLAAIAPVVRAQQFSGPGLRAHFRLMALVSSARDRGSGRTEADLLALHARVWAECLAAMLPDLPSRVLLTPWDGPVGERVRDTVLPDLHDLPEPVTVDLDTDRVQARHYYRGAALGLRVVDGDVVLDVGDGGVTDWTARLTGDAKERCVVSCLATSRLADLVPG